MLSRKTPTFLLMASLAFAAVFAAVAFYISGDGWGRGPSGGDIGRRSSGVPVYGELYGVYTFTDQNGQPFSTAGMNGRMWLVNFFFTSCNGPCPLMTSKMAALMNEHPNLHALSLTTDPETDTTDVLKAYGEKFKADTKRWTMARSEEKNLERFGQDVLKLPVGETPDAHSTRIVLIDAKGQIRGWYDSQEPDVVSVLSTAISSL